MPDKRKVTEQYIINSIQSLTPKSAANADLYKARFAKMSDTDFKRFMDRLKSGEEVLMIVSPNHAKDGLSLDNNIQVGKKNGHSFFTKIRVSGQEGLPDYLTPISMMVIDLPVRRLSQTSDKKIRVPKSTKVIDSLTGQVTGESKGASISAPEIQVLSAMGFEAPLVELLKYRGGDRQGRTAFGNFISKYGQVNLETLQRYGSGVESTSTLRTFLTAAHLRNNL